jgi:hypothetical protein
MANLLIVGWGVSCRATATPVDPIRVVRGGLVSQNRTFV